MKDGNEKLDIEMQAWFQSTGLKKTKTRQLLFEVLQSAGRPQSVPELQEAFAARKYFPNKTTLYREVEQLANRGLLFKVQLSESRVSYELAGDHHHHFVCQICARVTHLSFCEDVLKKLGRALQRQGKQVTHHNFEFFGICEICI